MPTNENEALRLEVVRLFNLLSLAEQEIAQRKEEQAKSKQEIAQGKERLSAANEGLEMGKRVLDELSEERDELAETVNTYRAKEAIGQAMAEASEQLTQTIGNILETYSVESLDVEFNLSWEFEGGKD